MKQRRVLVPPVWVVLAGSVLGVYATGLIYRAIVHGFWIMGLVGAALLAVALHATANPLAASMWKRRR